VSLGPTLSIIEKVEQHIKKKTHKPITQGRTWGGTLSGSNSHGAHLRELKDLMNFSQVTFHQLSTSIKFLFLLRVLLA